VVEIIADLANDYIMIIRLIGEFALGILTLFLNKELLQHTLSLALLFLSQNNWGGGLLIRNNFRTLLSLLLADDLWWMADSERALGLKSSLEYALLEIKTSALLSG
jgi:hypothetical protein